MRRPSTSSCAAKLFPYPTLFRARGRARQYGGLLGRRGGRARVARSSRARVDPRRGSRALVSQLPGSRDAGDARLCVAARVSATTTFRGADRTFIMLFMVMQIGRASSRERVSLYV